MIGKFRFAKVNIQPRVAKEICWDSLFCHSDMVTGEKRGFGKCPQPLQPATQPRTIF